MRQLVKFILPFLIVLFLVDRSVYFAMNQVYQATRTGQTGGKLNLYLSSGSEFDAIILGNSRSLYQVNPDSFNCATFNLSHAGAKLSYQLGVISILKSNNKLPSTILLHVDPDDLIVLDTNKEMKKLKYFYLKDSFITEAINNISATEKLKFILRMYRFNGQIASLLKNFFATKMGHYRNDGYEVLPQRAQDSITTIYSAAALRQSEPSLTKLHQLPTLERILSFCKREDIRVICFTSPIFGETPARYFETSKKIQALLTKNGVEYINLIETPIEEIQHSPSYWRDAFHLNELGARYESSVLSDRLKELGLCQ